MKFPVRYNDTYVGYTYTSHSAAGEGNVLQFAGVEASSCDVRTDYVCADLKSFESYSRGYSVDLADSVLHRGHKFR